MMSLFHTHLWKEIARTYVAPIRVSRGGATDLTEQVARDMLRIEQELCSGVTTILWECADPKCCQLRKEKLLGKSAEETPR